MSVALYDLKCPSYQYVKCMTWAEFLIRLHGFRRDQENDMMMLREATWIIYTAPHNDPKKMKRTKDAFWPINKAVTKNKREVMMQRIKEVQEQYLKEKAEKDG